MTTELNTDNRFSTLVEQVVDESAIPLPSRSGTGAAESSGLRPWRNSEVTGFKFPTKKIVKGGDWS